MTTCRDIPPGLQRNWQNLGEMYVALGVRRSGDTGPGLAPPSTYADSQTLSYMVGPSGGAKRAIDISIFNDTAARACFYQWAGYDENTVNSRIAAIRSENPNNQDAADAAVQTYLGTLTPLQQQIYRVSGMINIFQQDYRLENGHNVGGGNRSNPDTHEAANPNIITDFEIQQYAAEALQQGDQDPQYEPTGGRILSGIHAFIGLMTYVTSAPPVLPRTPETRGVETHTTDPVNLAAPQGGWQTGDQVFINGSAYTPTVPLTGMQQLTIPTSALHANRVDNPLDVNTIEVRNNGQTLVTLPVRLNAPVAPEEVTTSTSWWDNPSHQHWVEAGAVTTVALIGTFLGARWLGRRSGEARAEVSEGARVEADRLRTEAEARVESLTKQIGDANGALAVVPAIDVAPREAELARLNSELANAQSELARLNGQSARPPLKNNVSDQQFNDASDAYTRAHDARLEQEAELDRAEAGGDQAQIDAAQAELTNRQQAEGAALNNVARMIRGKGSATPTIAEGYLTARRLQAEIVSLQANIATLEGQIAAPRAVARARGFLGAQPTP